MRSERADTGKSSALPLWRPRPERAADTRIEAFRLEAARRFGIPLPDYAALHRWSVERPEAFWRLAWEWLGLTPNLTASDRVLERGSSLDRDRWFPDVRVSLTENVLRRPDARPALIAWSESGERREISRATLARRVAQVAVALRAEGLAPGDRVVVVLPNGPEAIVAVLAAHAIGAICSLASPDYGAPALIDRFRALEPRWLFSAETTVYKGRRQALRPRMAELCRALPSIERVVEVRSAAGSPGTTGLPGRIDFDTLGRDGDDTPVRCERSAFHEPAFVLASSGTTGPPKCLVHSAGAILLQLWKEHVLHYDVRPGDRFFYYTSTGWNMWYWLLTALAAEATVVLFDGSPFHPGPGALFDLAERERITHFGVSPAFLGRVERDGLAPARTHDLEALRCVLSTGAPLPPRAFEFVYRHVKRDVCLSSISGGTEVMACFASGHPAGPVWSGQLQVPALGMRTEVFDERGRPREHGKGELVCSGPFPSLPLGFFGEPDGERYRASYLERYPGAWHHGDYAEHTPQGGFVIHGRSDATLKPNGVRIGTAEIYRPVNALPEVEDSLAVGQDWDGDVRVVLFVKLERGYELDAALDGRIRRAIRDAASPRHVPARIVAVDDVPYTRNGKLAELAVREQLHGRPVRNRPSLRNPESLAGFAGRPELSA